MEWSKVTDVLPDDGRVVLTKIDDEHGERNVCRLRRRGDIWFTEDDKMYVYYTPTHWKNISQNMNGVEE